MIQKIKKILSQAIADHIFPGCVVGVVDADHNRTIVPGGNFTYEPGAPEVTGRSIYDVASITKAIPVSCCALKLIESGKLSCDDLLIQHVPEYRGDYRDEIRIQHLLTHTLDFDFRLSALKNESADSIINTLLTVKLKRKPGTSFFYANATSILLGLVIEKATGTSLDTVADQLFFAPLGMNATSFFPETCVKEMIVPTECDPWRGRCIQGEIHDESAWALRPKIIAGSAGLFSTANDLLIFLDMLLNNGIHNGVKFFESKTLSTMCTNQIGHLGLTTGLGWELAQRHYMGDACSSEAIGKTGFTGCLCMIDRRRNKAMIMLSNYTFPHRKPDREEINRVRKAIVDIIFAE